MSDPTEIVAKESVKAAGELAKELGSFLARILGTVPEDAVGVLGGDWLHHARIRNATRLMRRTQELLSGRGTKEQTTTPLSPSVAVPLLNAAQDESRDELQELWARLLANSMDASRPFLLRRHFITTLQDMEVLDVRIINKLNTAEALTGERIPFWDELNGIDWRAELGVSADEFTVSITNLRRLGCLQAFLIVLGGREETFNGFTEYDRRDRRLGQFKLEPFGRELLRALKF